LENDKLLLLNLCHSESSSVTVAPGKVNAKSGKDLKNPFLKCRNPNSPFSCIQNHCSSTHLTTNTILDQSVSNLISDKASDTQGTVTGPLCKK
jgi:hypothetical protein